MIYEYKVGERVVVDVTSSLFFDFAGLPKDTEFTVCQIDEGDDELPYELRFLFKGNYTTQWAFTKDLYHYNPIRIGGE